MPYSDEKLKVLGQLSPVANILSEIYAVPENRDASISSIVVTNRHTSQGTFSLAIAVDNEFDDVKQYIYYQLLIPENETFIATVGFSIGSNDRIRVISSNGLMSFNIFGSEVTY